MAVLVVILRFSKHTFLAFVAAGGGKFTIIIYVTLV